MTWLKWAGIIAILVSGTFLGYVKSQSFTQHTAALQAVLRLLKDIKSNLQYKNDLFADCVVESVKSNNFFNQEQPFAEKSLAYFTRCACSRLPVDNIEKEAFSKALLEAGHGLQAEELQRLDYYIVQFENFLAKAQIQETQSKKLYLYLGIYGALALCIIIV
ncbi:MAG: stage III sporulation protein AB [Oscillospiraceae bacterium]|nr:stage III sporulation protein AB [Oscillospiraceae bacterium]